MNRKEVEGANRSGEGQPSFFLMQPLNSSKHELENMIAVR